MTAISKQQKLMNIAKSVALLSKDRSTQVGALILSANNEPLSFGYNGFCRGADDDCEENHERPLKYLHTEHGERNAIYNAARTGTSLMNSSMYITSLLPCIDCARAIAQSGISKVYVEKDAMNPNNPRSKVWMENWPVSLGILEKAGVQVMVVN
jgi:dCMP deaminase